MQTSLSILTNQHGTLKVKIAINANMFSRKVWISGFVHLSSTGGLQNFLEFLEWDASYGLSENAGSITLLIRFLVTF